MMWVEPTVNLAKGGPAQQASPKAPADYQTKPLLFGPADRGPRGENLKDFNNTSNPSFMTVFFSFITELKWGLGGCQCGHARIKEKIGLCPHIIAHMAPTPTGIIAWNFPVLASPPSTVMCFHVWWQLPYTNTEVLTGATPAPVCRGSNTG